MIITKGCPRCHGDLAHVSDIGDAYYSCLQCGYIQYSLDGGAPRAIEPVTAERPLPVAVTRDEVHRRRLRRLAERQPDRSVA